MQFIVNVPIQSYLFIALYLIIVFTMGRFFSGILKLSNTPFECVFRGFFYSLAIFQVLESLLLRVINSFQVLFISYSFFILVSLIGGWICLRRDGLDLYKEFIRRLDRKSVV